MLLQIFAKAEFLNPGGSVKDRVALRIIQDAFAGGRLTEGGLITEGTAGSTGRHPPIKSLVGECPTLRADCYLMQTSCKSWSILCNSSLIFVCAMRSMSHSSSSMCLCSSHQTCTANRTMTTHAAIHTCQHAADGRAVQLCSSLVLSHC